MVLKLNIVCAFFFNNVIEEELINLQKQQSSPEEIRRRKILKKGIQLTLLVCGEEGLGKASFINTLCNQEVISKDESNDFDPQKAHIDPGLMIVRKQIDIVEDNSTPINLSIISTPGFGDNINNDQCVGKVINYLEQQFDAVLKEECRIRRNAKFEDGRPHACLYFIRATSKGLRELDVEAMKSLSSRVNVIPIIAKSDTLTEDELALNKALILQGIKANEISVYDFALDIDDDSEFVDEQFFLRNNLPFAISGSYDVVQNENEDSDYTHLHIREYPWGTFKVEDLNHSDFNYLKNVLFGSHLQELKESTHSILYENYRRVKLTENTKHRPSSKSATGEDASLLDNYTYSNDPVILESEPENGSFDEQNLRDLLEKKKQIETYSNELKVLENKIRVSSLKNSKIGG